MSLISKATLGSLHVKTPTDLHEMKDRFDTEEPVIARFADNLPHQVLGVRVGVMPDGTWWGSTSVLVEQEEGSFQVYSDYVTADTPWMALERTLTHHVDAKHIWKTDEYATKHVVKKYGLKEWRPAKPTR